MRVHRLLVDSATRVSGHLFDFRYDISRFSTDQDFLEDAHMVTVESCTPINYSEFQSSFTSDSRHPPSLLLTWDKPVANVIGQPDALCHLQQFEAKGIYGVVADSQYVSRNTMGVLLQGDTLNKSGVLQFRVLQETAAGFVQCRAPAANSVYGGNYRFMLVFWTYPKPESPLNHGFYRLFLRTRDRISGIAANCLIPIRPPTSNAMNPIADSWMVVLESISILKSTSVVPSLIMRSDTFRASSGLDDRIVAVFPRTKTDFKAIYGQKLSIKQATHDTIGVPIKLSLDSLNTVHLQIQALSGATPGGVEDYTAVFVLYKAS